MEGQVILHNLAGEVKSKESIVIPAEKMSKLIDYVNGLERALADMLRFTYERSNRPPKRPAA